MHGTALRNELDKLVCPHNHDFRIVGGVPRFVESSSYAVHFGIQWNTFRRTQLDSYKRLPISEERLRDCLGEKIYTSLAAKQVLECGCGAGRFTEILLARGAFVTAVDLSDAVEVRTRTVEMLAFLAGSPRPTFHSCRSCRANSILLCV